MIHSFEISKFADKSDNNVKEKMDDNFTHRGIERINQFFEVLK